MLKGAITGLKSGKKLLKGKRACTKKRQSELTYKICCGSIFFPKLEVYICQHTCSSRVVM